MNGDFKDLIIQVISSWQVIVVTVVILLYMFLVNYVGSMRRRRRFSPLPGPMKRMKKNEKPQDTEEVVDDSELGLEE